MDKKTHTTVLVLCLVPFIMVLGNSMLIPVLPAIRQALHVNLSQVGLLITAFSVPAGLVIPFAGLLSDRIGRKPVMAPALLVYGIGGILAGLAGVFVKDSYYLILGARIIQGIGAGGTYQLAMALAGDEIQSKERAQALGFLEAANGLGKVVSPLAGAALALISWQTPFFVYGILAFPIAAAVFFFAGEKQKTAGSSQSMKAYFKGFAQIVRKKGASLGGSLPGGHDRAFYSLRRAQLLFGCAEKEYHIQVFGRGLILALPVLAMALTSFALGIILKKKPAALIKPFIFAGLLTVAAGQALFALLPAKAWGSGSPRPGHHPGRLGDRRVPAAAQHPHHERRPAYRTGWPYVPLRNGPVFRRGHRPAGVRAGHERSEAPPLPWCCHHGRPPGGLDAPGHQTATGFAAKHGRRQR